MDLDFVKGQFNEEQLENAIIELFVQQGYTHVFGDAIHRRLEDILLEDDLRAYLEKRYKDDNLTESEIQKIINRLKLIPSEPLYDGNRDAFWLVNERLDLQREDTAKVGCMWVILILTCLKNIFKVVNQYSVQGERLRRPICYFYNGIPIAIFEFKSAVRKCDNP